MHDLNCMPQDSIYNSQTCTLIVIVLSFKLELGMSPLFPHYSFENFSKKSADYSMKLPIILNNSHYYSSDNCELTIINDESIIMTTEYHYLKITCLFV